MENDVNRLKRQVFFTMLGSLMVDAFGIVAVILYFRPELVGVGSEEIHHYQGEIIWLIIGIFFMLFGAYGLLFSNHWKLRLLQVYRKGSTVPMNLTIEVADSSDSTDYYALLSPVSAQNDPAGKWRVQLWLGLSKVQKPLLEGMHRCQVYFDDRLNRPAIIQSDFGLLWSIGGSGAARKL